MTAMGSTSRTKRTTSSKLSRQNQRTKPKKIKVACMNCHRQKHTCNGQKPQCARCQKSGKHCIYGEKGRTEKYRSILEMQRKKQTQLNELASADTSPRLPVNLAEQRTGGNAN